MIYIQFSQKTTWPVVIFLEKVRIYIRLFQEIPCLEYLLLDGKGC